jgi:hypothetical protein
MSLANPTAVLAEDDIKHPVQGISQPVSFAFRSGSLPASARTGNLHDLLPKETKALRKAFKAYAMALKPLKNGISKNLI